MAATAFIRTAVSHDEPLTDAATRQTVREDVEVVDNSLNFINDLLRNVRNCADRTKFLCTLSQKVLFTTDAGYASCR